VFPEWKTLHRLCGGFISKQLVAELKMPGWAAGTASQQADLENVIRCGRAMAFLWILMHSAASLD